MYFPKNLLRLKVTSSLYNMLLKDQGNFCNQAETNPYCSSILVRKILNQIALNAKNVNIPCHIDEFAIQHYGKGCDKSALRK